MSPGELGAHSPSDFNDSPRVGFTLSHEFLGRSVRRQDACSGGQFVDDTDMYCKTGYEGPCT